MVWLKYLFRVGVRLLLILYISAFESAETGFSNFTYLEKNYDKSLIYSIFSHTLFSVEPAPTVQTTHDNVSEPDNQISATSDQIDEITESMDNGEGT